MRRVQSYIRKENRAYVYAPFVFTEESDGPCCGSYKLAVRVPFHRNMRNSVSYDIFSNTSAWNLGSRVLLTAVKIFKNCLLPLLAHTKTKILPYCRPVLEKPNHGGFFQDSFLILD